MADPTPVNGQITDAVTQTNITTLGNAPSMALATVYHALAQTTAMASQNAVAFQQTMNVIQAALAARVASDVDD